MRSSRPRVLDNIESPTAEILRDFLFDLEEFELVRNRLLTGDAEESTHSNEVVPPEPSDFVWLPQAGSPRANEIAEIGQAAIRRGEVGVVVLAGGMATRFGGLVKAVTAVAHGYSFLDLKLADIEQTAQLAGGRVPVFVLTSFATREPIASALGKRPPMEVVPIEILSQSVSLRLTTQGEVYRDPSGQPSPYATGHGDLLFTLRRSGALSRFRAGGGRVLLVSNVDNVVATLDPRVIGLHDLGFKDATVEVVRRDSTDRGGLAVCINGRTQVLEEFRLPRRYPTSAFHYFNTNTFIFDAAAIDRDFPLDWFLVHRNVNGHEVVQAERLLGQVTEFLSTQLLVVERHGSEARFLPIKGREDLKNQQPRIHALVHARGGPPRYGATSPLLNSPVEPVADS